MSGAGDTLASGPAIGPAIDPDSCEEEVVVLEDEPEGDDPLKLQLLMARETKAKGRTWWWPFFEPKLVTGEDQRGPGGSLGLRPLQPLLRPEEPISGCW